MATAREASGRREGILGILRQVSEPIGIARIAEQLGIHPNTARFHLENLAADELIERVDARPSGVGRPPALYQAVPLPHSDDRREYRMLAEILLRSLESAQHRTSDAIAAGREWGRRETASTRDQAVAQSADAVGALTGMLERLGFAPERPTSVGQKWVNMRHCPFRELALSNQATVCAAHLGIMQGISDELNLSVSADRLDTFVRADLCVAHLSNSSSS